MKYLEQLRAQLTEKLAEGDALADELDALTVDEAGELRSLDDDASAKVAEVRGRLVSLAAETAEDGELRTRIAELEAVEAARGAARPAAGVKRSAPAFIAKDDPYDVEIRSLPRTIDAQADVEDRAMRIIEGERRLSDEVRGRLDAWMGDESVNRSGALARHLIATGRPAYRSAFSKLTRMDGTAAVLTAEEAAAIEDVRAINITTAGEGGYLMPFVVDPTIVVLDNGQHNPIRGLATVTPVAADNWHGINMSGVTASWRGESDEAAESQPTIARPELKVKGADVFVPFTVEAEDDFASLASAVAEVIGLRKSQLEGAAFTTGSGSGNIPQGLITGLVAASATVAATALDKAAIYALSDAIPPAYDGASRFMFAKQVHSLIRLLLDEEGHSLFDSRENTLLGDPITKNSYMPTSIAANPATTNLIVAGDVKSAYRIIDRIGLRIETVPHLFGTNGRPTGERGWYARWRVGAGVTNPAAARVLRVTPPAA